MNIPFLLLTAAVIVATIIFGYFGFVRLKDWAEPYIMLGFIISSVLIVLAFLAKLGVDKITETTSFRLEKTPFRVIITAEDAEKTFVDAFTVVNAEKIKKIKLIQPRNAFGFDCGEVSLIPIFEEK